METTTLSSGASVSRLIKGGWQLAGGHGPVDRHAAIRDMFAYAEAGFTAFDCADIYTGVESLIGEFLREWNTTHPALAGTLRVHTKCVPDLNELSRVSSGSIERLVTRSLDRLGVARIDLVQLHWWDYDIPGYVRAAEALVSLRDRGLIAEIGATNFDTPRITELCDHGIPLTTHQLQYSPLDRRADTSMLAACAARGVTVLCYGVLAGGFFSERWLGQQRPPEPLENRSLTKYLLIIDEFGGWDAFQAVLRGLHDIAQALGTSIGSVVIRWVLDRPGIGAVILGARNASHLPATMRAMQISLSPQQRTAVDELLIDARGPTGDVYALERQRGGRHAAIMRYNLNATDGD